MLQHSFHLTIDPSYSSILQEGAAQKMDSHSSNSPNYHIRSTSLPSRTHPMIQIVEEELNKLKSWVEMSASSNTTAGAICYGLSGLQELCKSMDELLNLPLTIQAVSRRQTEKWINEFLDKSVGLLDICGVAKDMVSQCKENVRDLQSSLRRGKMTGSTIEANNSKYFSSRRQMRKDAKRSVASLKLMIQETNHSGTTTVDLDHHASTVIRVLQEVNSTSNSIFQSVFEFLQSRSSKQKTSRWALVARLVQKERVGCEDHLMEKRNELESVDAALHSLCENDQSETGRVQILQNRVQILEGSLEGIENQLEVMFRCLIQSRTTILNAF